MCNVSVKYLWVVEMKVIGGALLEYGAFSIFFSEGTILQQKSLSQHVPVGTCTIIPIIPNTANIYVNGLNTCTILKQW